MTPVPLKPTQVLSTKDADRLQNQYNLQSGLILFNIFILKHGNIENPGAWKVVFI